MRSINNFKVMICTSLRQTNVLQTGEVVSTECVCERVQISLHLWGEEPNVKTSSSEID